MNTIVRVEASLGAAHPPTEGVRRYARASRADNTRRAYRAQWKLFEAWCAVQGQQPLPASAETVAEYLSHRADSGVKVATVNQSLNAIAAAHEVAGQPSPRHAALVQAVWEGIRRTLKVAQVRKSPLTVDLLAQVLVPLPPTLTGLRNRALLLLGFSAALRRSELVALEVQHLRFQQEGVVVHLASSKTDQAGEGEDIAIHYGKKPETCPVRALKAWLAAAGHAQGPLFQGINRHGQLSGKAMWGESVAVLVKAAVGAVGLEEKDFSGHSMRAGLATTSARQGKSTLSIMKQTRHKSERMVAVYVREANLFQGNVTEDIGL